MVQTRNHDIPTSSFYCQKGKNNKQRVSLILHHIVAVILFLEETQPTVSQLSKPVATVQGPAPVSAPPTPDSPGPSSGALMPSPVTPLPQPASSSSPGCGSSIPEPAGAPGATAATPGNGETEEDKAKKLLYCSLCKVAVNSLSQLEAHNKGEFLLFFFYLSLTRTTKDKLLDLHSSSCHE